MPSSTVGRGARNEDLKDFHNLSNRRIGNFLGSPTSWALLLGTLGFLQRLGLYLLYQPVGFGDTPSYLRLAAAVSNFSLNGYDGTRVPGYPFFLTVLGEDPQTVWLAQMVLGWIIAMLWFWIAWRTSGSPLLGFLVGCCYNILPALILFEANLITETLTTFWITLSLALIVLFGRTDPELRALIFAFLCGIAASLAGLVRPLFFTLPVWLLPFVWTSRELKWKHRVLQAGVFSIGPLILLGGWLFFINQKYGMISPTTMGGYNLVQHTGEYFEDLPEEHAAIRDIYIEFRDQKIAERGSQTNAIWDAIPAIIQVSGLNFYDLSRELQRLSLFLILRNPDLYIKNAALGWIDFWKAPVYWKLESFQGEFIRNLMPLVVFTGRGLTLIMNGLFLLLSGVSILSRDFRNRMGFDRHILLAGGYVWLTSIVQTLVDHGDNPRFLIPLQMFVVYVVLRSVWSVYESRRGKWKLQAASE